MELEITADQEWMEQTAGEAIAVLDTASDREQRAEAARTLRFLGSRRAIEEMARRVSGDTSERYLENLELEKGLFGARDRGHAIGFMQRRIDDPAAEIGVNVLRVTAALRLTRDTPGPLQPFDKHRAMLAVDERRLQVLARSGRLIPRLRATFAAAAAHRGLGTVPSGGRMAVTPALGAFAPLVEKILTALPPRQCDAVLAAYGLTLADDNRFAPMLQRLAARGSRIASVLVHDLTLPPTTVAVKLDQPSAYLVAGFDGSTQRRQYQVWGAYLPFTALARVFKQLPPRTSLIWVDHFDYALSSWVLDRQREFRRVQAVAEKHGVTLTRR